MAIAIQFGLKYFSIYGTRLDKEKKINVLKYLFPSWYHNKIEPGDDLCPYVSSYITVL